MDTRCAHNGLAAAISRTSARAFASIDGGRPTRRWRDRRIQRRRNLPYAFRLSGTLQSNPSPFSNLTFLFTRQATPG